MSSTQTWRIKGQVYNHAQLMELKKQGLDPRKDDIEMKFVTPGVMENQESKVKPKAVKSKASEPIEVASEELLEVTVSKPTEEPEVAPEGAEEVPFSEPYGGDGEIAFLDRFEELKAKGFTNLKGNERREYKKLKEKFEQ